MIATATEFVVTHEHRVAVLNVFKRLGKIGMTVVGEETGFTYDQMDAIINQDMMLSGLVEIDASAGTFEITAKGRELLAPGPRRAGSSEIDSAVSDAARTAGAIDTDAVAALVARKADSTPSVGDLTAFARSAVLALAAEKPSLFSEAAVSAARIAWTGETTQEPTDDLRKGRRGR